jgi:DNA-binding transcriptional LysR family regulator
LPRGRFRRLGYFLQVAELGSLLRTSERLGIAQPSLSRQMRLLEEELGVTLFTRGPRGMQLTEIGEALQAQIAGPLRQVGHALYGIRSLPRDTQGSVTFGMPPSVSRIVAAGLLRRVGEHSPGIRLQIVEALSGHLLGMMKRGELDAAVLYGPTPTGLNAARLLDDDLALVAGAKAVIGPHLDFRALEDRPLVLPSGSHGLRLAIESAAAKSRVKLRIDLELDSLDLIKSLVIAGDACSILPIAAVRDELKAKTIQTCTIRRPALTRKLFLTMQSEAEAPRAIVQVDALARAEVDAAVKEGRWPGARLLSVGTS